MSSSKPEFYKFEVGQLPDELFDSHVPIEKWFENTKCTTTTNDKNGFPPNSLQKLSPIHWEIELERIIGISLYMAGNVLPFVVPSLAIAAFLFSSSIAKLVLQFVLVYTGTLASIENFYFKPKYLKRYNRSNALSETDILDNQYLFTERHTCKYLSTTYIWPKSIHRPALENTPVIYCAVPHGVAPLGMTAYPIWSKVWNSRLCHWTCAPILLKLPVIGYFVKKIGYIPAKSQHILDTLTKKEENVGLILDGIAGMFQTHPEDEETIHIVPRKGIIKIALKAGAPIVPVYGFGHTSLYTVIVDPFGIMERLSNAMEASLTPFFGRFGWFLGPPRRVPVAVCLGEPLWCPQMEKPTQADIDKYHQQMLDHFQQVFDLHKAAYGWQHKKIKFV